MANNKIRSSSGRIITPRISTTGADGRPKRVSKKEITEKAETTSELLERGRFRRDDYYPDYYGDGGDDNCTFHSLSPFTLLQFNYVYFYIYIYIYVCCFTLVGSSDNFGDEDNRTAEEIAEDILGSFPTRYVRFIYTSFSLNEFLHLFVYFFYLIKFNSIFFLSDKDFAPLMTVKRDE